MKKLNSTGSSPLHIVLILVIIGMIGGVGYYVYNSQKETKQNLDNANNSLNSASQSKEEKKEEEKNPTTPETKYLVIEEWGIKLSQPKDETIAVSKPMGEDLISGALGTIYIYAPKYDEDYTCGSNEGETNKAKILTIQKFSANSNIENNTKNKPTAIKTVGEFKYGIYSLPKISDCYASEAVKPVESLVQSYLEAMEIKNKD